MSGTNNPPPPEYPGGGSGVGRQNTASETISTPNGFGGSGRNIKLGRFSRQRSTTIYSRCQIINSALGTAALPAVLRCAADLVAKLTKDGKDLSDCRVLVMYGGGKDSSFVVAKMRAVQLSIYETLGKTFALRVATFRHAGMPRPVQENIHRTYSNLGLYGDASVELILVDGDEVSTFQVDSPLPDNVRLANRRAILMAAHLSGGDPRSTYCDACNLGMARSFQVAARYGAPVDLIITGDSPTEQLRYVAWTRHLAIHFGLPDTDREGRDLNTTLDRLTKLHSAYDSIIHGPEVTQRKPLADTGQHFAEFFSIYSYSAYELGAHRPFVENFLRFEFDPLAWAFTESDCANPYLMATARGLMFERRRGRTYAEGAAEYVSFALDLMRRKRFPDDLVDRMASRFAGDAGAEALRAIAAGYLSDAYDLQEKHLVAALFSPFTDQGVRLEAWVSAEAPELLPMIDQVRGFASGLIEPTEEVASIIREATALEPDQVHHLWRSPLAPNLADPAAKTNPIGLLRRRDPHKAMILSPQADGSVRPEMISGR